MRSGLGMRRGYPARDAGELPRRPRHFRRMPRDDPQPSRLLAALRAHGVPRRYRRGEALFLDGDIADRVFVLERGWVVIRSAVAAGGDTVLGLRGPGEVLGELSALDGKPRSATAVPVADV